jgi:hypothetical protein
VKKVICECGLSYPAECKFYKTIQLKVIEDKKIKTSGFDLCQLLDPDGHATPFCSHQIFYVINEAEAIIK